MRSLDDFAADLPGESALGVVREDDGAAFALVNLYQHQACRNN